MIFDYEKDCDDCCKTECPLGLRNNNGMILVGTAVCTKYKYHGGLFGKLITFIVNAKRRRKRNIKKHVSESSGYICAGLRRQKMKDLTKRNTLSMITLLAKKCKIVEAWLLYKMNKNIITYDEYQKAYADGVDAYYQKQEPI